MKSTLVSVAQLKQGLSSFLNRAGQGQRFIVMNRNNPVAELGPLRSTDTSPKSRLIAVGKIVSASRKPISVERYRLEQGPIDTNDILDWVRSD